MSKHPLITRRAALVTSSAALAFGCSGLSAEARDAISERLGAIQTRIGGRVGIHALDTQTGRRISLDETSRYAMASTFKWLLAAGVLSHVERGALSLEKVVTFTDKDMLSHAPVTSKSLAKGSLTIRELCAAVVEVSDNPAANLLLRLIGGPAGLTQFIRGLGDTETRLDRFELELNSNLPGDPRDTTTPRAMVGSMERVLLKDTLSKSSRDLLTQWLVNSTTGLQRLRAGFPKDWKAGDKTGTGANGAVNDLSILWPPGRKPILMAVYLSESKQTTEVLSAAHAEIARVVVGDLTG